mmetsp:Transcript_101181/g.200985  ORF Transcript_101181/g.200985 Transcript_101181/m.200985 type:complete len:616 (-) Transcript_101181:92-1939(-)
MEKPEEDARSEESFQSADDEDYDDFDLPQDVGVGQPRAQSGPSGALPPGLSGGAPGLSGGSDGAGTERWNLRKDGNKELLEPIFNRLCGDREHVKISKMFSFVLRHAAHKLDVTIRKDGFVRLREIMKLRNFRPYDLEELMAVVYFDEKERYTMVREYDGELLIRANQGHTMKVVEDDLLLETIEEAGEVSECVHGTYLVHWPFIKRQGLSRVARNHIHLANGLPEDGKIRGMRSTAELFVYVNVTRAMEDGITFHKSKNDVILTQGFDGWLPVKYFTKVVRIDYNTCDIEELEFDNSAHMPTWAAELAPSGPGEQGTYLIKNLEALISNCKKRLQEICRLKELAEEGRQLDEDELFKVSQHALAYTELQSLEQRFRQHKGHRRDSHQEKEQRAKDQAEAGTVKQRQDRDVTPPWEREREAQLESQAAARVTEKDKEEWAAIGRRRDTAAEGPPPSRQRAAEDDPWAALGRGREHSGRLGLPKESPRAADEEGSWRRGLPAAGSSGRTSASNAGNWRFGGGDPDTPQQQQPNFGAGGGREDSWRAPAREDAEGLGRAQGGPGSASSKGGGPPRFFNSKKAGEGGSWRDRITQPQGGEAPSWRDRMSKSSDTMPSG